MVTDDPRLKLSRSVGVNVLGDPCSHTLYMFAGQDHTLTAEVQPICNDMYGLSCGTGQHGSLKLCLVL